MKAVLFDGPGCIGCRACENACKEKFNLPPLDMSGVTPGEQLPAEPTTGVKTMIRPAELSAYTWIKIRLTEIDDEKGFRQVYTLRKCMHCIEPACVAACPVGALHKNEDGSATVYDEKRCIGCRYCMLACPFGVPTFQWDKKVSYIAKCIYCPDLLAKDQPPACVAACAKRTKCITIDDRDKQLAKARKMIADGNAATPGKYIDHIYGEHEVGGTNWIYLSGEPFETIGLRTFKSTTVPPDFQKKVSWGGNWGDLTSMPEEPVPTNAKHAMEAVPIVLPGVAVVMTGLYWVFKRKDKLGQERAAAKTTKEVKK